VSRAANLTTVLLRCGVAEPTQEIKHENYDEGTEQGGGDNESTDDDDDDGPVTDEETNEGVSNETQLFEGRSVQREDGTQTCSNQDKSVVIESKSLGTALLPRLKHLKLTMWGEEQPNMCVVFPDAVAAVVRTRCHSSDPLVCPLESIEVSYPGMKYFADPRESAIIHRAWIEELRTSVKDMGVQCITSLE
jgi:hypothetical protein